LKKPITETTWQEFLLTATEVQVWGGTERNLGAVLSIGRNRKALQDYISACKTSFGEGDRYDGNAFKVSQLRSNAGFTKIYSLLFDDFIIYDSRVAAALGMLVVRYCQDSKRRDVPEDLCFAVMSGQSKALRNPSTLEFRFNKCPSTGSAQWCEHIWSNVRANWILSTAVRETAFAKAVHDDSQTFPVTPLRALEAALFMIGYDLGGNHPYPAAARPNSR
jgi:hypothetical protein